jgi:hypothetical protein
VGILVGDTQGEWRRDSKVQVGGPKTTKPIAAEGLRSSGVRTASYLRVESCNWRTKNNKARLKAELFMFLVAGISPHEDNATALAVA